VLVIGLTGGIGSGKSTIANRFRALGTPIIDADILAHELVLPGQPALQEIINTFGFEVITPTGQLNRTALRQRIFTNPTERTQLEAILHPRIRTEIQLQLNKLQTTYVMLVVPLLFESKFNNLCHRILVVDIPEAIQITRIHKRNGLSTSEITAIINSQWQRTQRIAAANDVIDNSDNLDQLNAKIEVLHEYYLSIGTAQCLARPTYLNTP